MKKCNIPDCEKPHKGKGYCQMHLVRLQKHGDFELHYATKHNAIHSAEYRAWCNMKERCYNKNKKEYGHYGGRGITVCEEWVHDFARFLEDMGSKPIPELTLDRKDNDKGYSPDNCRWVTRGVQQSNKRAATNTGEKYITYYGSSYHVVMRIDGKQQRVRITSTLEEAITVRDEILNQIHANFKQIRGGKS